MEYAEFDLDWKTLCILLFVSDLGSNRLVAMDELYIIEKTWPNTTVLATSKSKKDGQSHPVFWTNQYGKGRVLGTTYGHSKDSFSDKAFLETVINGIVWAGGR